MSVEQFIHQELRQHAGSLMALIAECSDRVMSPEEVCERVESDAELTNAYNWVMTTLSHNHVVGYGGPVYMVPFLDPGFCAGLMIQAEELARVGGWRRNECEDSPYQIPEIVVQHRNLALHDLLADLIPYLNIYHAMAYQAVPKVIGSIQFTKYSQSDCNGGNWHHDLDSDFTATVSLAPHAFEGGGTDIRLSPTKSMRIPPLPTGHALLFNGQKIHHKGAPVTKGERHLLTYWLSSK